MAVDYERGDWYQTPQFYDIIYEQLTAAEAEFLAAVYERYCPGKVKRALEPACGSGRLLEAMAQRGFEVSGFDAEPKMVRYARRRLRDAGIDAEVDPGRLESFRVSRTAELAFCTVSSFKYLATEEDARAHLQCVARALRAGGVYVLGFHLTDYSDTRGEVERWRATRDGVRVTCTVRTSPPHRRHRREDMVCRLLAKSTTGAFPVFRSETRWQFRTYSARQFRSLVRTVPELELVQCYDLDYDIDRPRKLGRGRLDAVVVLRKR